MFSRRVRRTLLSLGPLEFTSPLYAGLPRSSAAVFYSQGLVVRDAAAKIDSLMKMGVMGFCHSGGQQQAGDRQRKGRFMYHIKQ